MLAARDPPASGWRRQHLLRLDHGLSPESPFLVADARALSRLPRLGLFSLFRMWFFSSVSWRPAGWERRGPRGLLLWQEWRCSPLELAQVYGEVVGEPAIPGPEGLGLGGLGVPHDAEPVAEGLEGDYLIVPHPEPPPLPGEVGVLGGETQHPGVGVDRLLPFYGDSGTMLPTGVNLVQMPGMLSVPLRAILHKTDRSLMGPRARFLLAWSEVLPDSCAFSQDTMSIRTACTPIL